ncbi:hypothetical protein FQN60_016392, partial [Etheostoma spectabile]
VRIIHPEESSIPVQCETNPTGLNGVAVYDDLTYALPYVENQQPIDRTPSSDNSVSVIGELQQQWSSEDTLHQEENLMFRPHGYSTSGGRHLRHGPFCRTTTTHRVPVNWWRQNGPWLVMALAGVVLFLLDIIFRLFFIFFLLCFFSPGGVFSTQVPQVLMWRVCGGERPKEKMIFRTQNHSPK